MLCVPTQAVRAHPSRPIMWRMNARSYWYDSETPGALCSRRGVHADLPYPKLKHKLPAFWIHTVRFGSKMYVLDPTRAAIQALAPTGAGSKYQWTGLDTEGLPVTQTAVLPA